MTGRIEPGALVQLTRGPMGAMAHPNDTRFVELTAPEGARGRYLQPQKGIAADNWHMLALAVNGDVLFVPVHERWFIVLAEVR